MENNRKLERYQLKAPAKVIPIDSGRGKRVIDLQTSNICAGGAFFHTLHSLPEGTPVDVEIALPLEHLEIIKESKNRVHLKVSGKVLRCEACGFAVCFDEDYHICRLNAGY